MPLTRADVHITAVCSFVSFQRGFPSVAQRTEAADIPLFSCVCHRMRDVTGSLSKAPVTDVTPVRFLSSVHPHVNDQVSFSRKAFLAHIAQVRSLLFEVLLLMRITMVLSHETSHTEPASKKLLHNMCLPMRLKLVFTKEVLVTGTALVWLLVGVRFLVGVQVLLRRKVHLTETAELWL